MEYGWLSSTSVVLKSDRPNLLAADAFLGQLSL